ncbi:MULTISPECIES: O-succinylhomoserine sulfhydrylase [unclassified Agrobacterium]|jgi:O-succinylhomoserine sulfhydrylase|uniref:O-succinylhomoserine sulfhydrylase n=1 Tax=unclassified Agrobacterium TaxID=2632611 RepID=UPI002448099E|nr:MULTISPECIES: O-succinylhomoserine sulfhydrylase [unclassified Agrobacterium]MDH0613094.1 O-succinylhomoserine sulfhydrylase [Agrobacterium sp. GD03872]MDH0694959.1 O-succinylhomoserine sulfhydrylase [Agrobacterium sp. GD03871]MDH1057643.1 O-succinylhomoserine sulfhydrylase [Agrobacterium sp. GD03992]MDH2208932.1 O-succinylhomoserine sulfhydrylase [Agrobacterium sp. GD03643]MDH2218423.1 O-succinylhomoserine sulfhydrylase [Agrobacterium sp. GD03638]
MSNKWRPATQLVHGGTLRSPYGETSEAIYLTQGFVYENSEAAEARFKGETDGFIYARYASPTNDMFEKRMCLLEGAEDARALASGMAAVTAAIMCQLRAGDHIVAARALFGSCRWVVETLAPKYGIECTLIDGRDLGNWEKAIQPNTRLFFLESPTNPTLEVVDIAGVAKLANQIGAKVVVDNVFATPLFQKPLELGAHIVVYSATKHIDGQGRCLGGVILSDKKWIEEELQDYFRHTGPAMSPFNAWTLLKGIETLPLRVKQQTANAGKIADFLADSGKVAKVIYPGRADHPQADIIARQMSGGSTLVAFELKGGKEAAFKLQNALEIVKISNNLGDAKSLITHPGTTTHKNLTDEARAELGISGGTLRLSCGIEDTDDLLEDLAKGLAAVSA